ncbi:MAG: hypothetical protein MZV64_24555 [Ignavibacteriales bacterium]|nr:hypothetical protein [Ignavibacteriales bacterium]
MPGISIIHMKTLKKKFNQPTILKHSDIVPLIEQLQNNKIFKVDKVGKSVEGRDIYLISVGSGKTKVFSGHKCMAMNQQPQQLYLICSTFSWMKLLSLILRNLILSNLSIYIIPMVNPDGAELFQRRNIVEIDLNRDVLRQQNS